MKELIQEWLNKAIESGWQFHFDSAQEGYGVMWLRNGDMIASWSNYDLTITVGGEMLHYFSARNKDELENWQF